MRLTNWIERKLGGHVNLFGKRVTIYGANAMHWGVNISTRRGYVCFRLPLPCFGRWWPLHLYVSPNATPWGATWGIGRTSCGTVASSMRHHAEMHATGETSCTGPCGYMRAK
jgi:hypothetical protein